MNDDNKMLEWIPDVKESQRHYEDFLEKYPIEKLKELTLEEYANSNKDSFCYTLEFGIEKLGSIKGSSAYKFGIYRYNKRPDDKNGRMSDDIYAWYSRYGDTSEKAFENILNKIVEVANAAKEFDLERIDKIDLSNMVKWKIAFLYSDYRLMNIFSEEALRHLSKKHGLKNADMASLSEMYKFLLRFRNEENIFEFSSKLWNEWQKGRNDKKYYAVGALFKSGNEDMTDYFIANNKWYDGYASNGDNRNEKILNEIKEGDILLLKSSATKGTNHDITFTRLKGLGIVIDRENYFTFKVNWLKSNEIPKDFDNISYRKTIELMRDDEMLRFVKNIIDNKTTMNNSNKYQKYIDILEANKNLILTGAPGTGKTFLAKQIAKEMGCSDNEIGFVQFHPSYDYTDFVEGLRPVEKDGNIGFERKDGVFKEFCKKAIENNCQKSTPIIRVSDNSFESIYQSLIIDIKQGRINHLMSPCKQHSKIRVFIDTINNTQINFAGGKRTKKDYLKLMFDYFKKKNIYDLSYEKTNFGSESYFKLIKDLTNGKINKIDYINYASVLQELLSRTTEYKDTNLTSLFKHDAEIAKSKSQDKNFIFIIDEINRGEISKIFGELFYCIDSGYRGTNGRVFTQYQNLVPEGDVFKKSFYVPENVYIIGTMNDIDRSVESMDFAFRRRFAFMEVKADENLEMLYEVLDENLADKSKLRLLNLNKKISEMEDEGLSSAYHIGASYFLKIKDYNGDFEKLWNYHLIGLLREYLRGMSNIEAKIESLKAAYDNESASNN